MLLSQNGNLLPEGSADGVALKTPDSKHQLSRFRGFRKLNELLKKSTIARVFLGISLVFYFSGYQPTLAIPPIKKAIVKAEFDQAQDIDAATLSEPFSLPHPGYLTTRFSSWHPGIDLAAGLGMPIHPIAKGTIVETTIGFWGLGHFVIVEHQQGFRSTYGHMGKVYVKNGDSVDKNSILGEVGMTGHTSGPHTHLEITKNGQYINPLTILPEVASWPTSAGIAPQGASETQEKPKTQKSKTVIIPLNLSRGEYNTQNKEDSKVTLLPRLPKLQPDQNGSHTALFPD